MGVGRTVAVNLIGVALAMAGAEAVPVTAKVVKAAVKTAKPKRKIHARSIRATIATPPVRVAPAGQQPSFPIVPEADYSYLDRANVLAEAIGAVRPDTSFRYDDGYLHAWRTRSGDVMIAEPLRQGERRYFFAPGEHVPFFVTEPLHAFGYRGEAFVAGYDSRGMRLTASMLPAFDAAAARLSERGRALYFAAHRERQDEAAATARYAYGDGRQNGGTGAWRFGRADEARSRYRSPERERPSDDRPGHPRPAPTTAGATGSFAGPPAPSAGTGTRRAPETRDDGPHVRRTAAEAPTGAAPGIASRETDRSRPAGNLRPDMTPAPIATSGDGPTRRDARPRREDASSASPLMVVPSANEPDGIGAAVPSPTRSGADAPVRTGRRAELSPGPSAIDESERPAAAPVEAPDARDESKPGDAALSRPAAPSDSPAGRSARDAPPQSATPVAPPPEAEPSPAVPVVDRKRQDAAPAAEAKPEPDAARPDQTRPGAAPQAPAVTDPNPSKVDPSDESSAVAQERTMPD